MDTNNFRCSWTMRITSLLAGLLLSSAPAFSQVPTVQDCDGAIPVCQNVYSEANSYSGIGNYTSEVNTANSCLGGANAEVNSVWYTFTVQQSGNLCFSITPNVSADDYDWGVYDLTNNPCSDIFNNAAMEVSCNFSGVSGVTGPNGQAGTQNEPCIPVVAGSTYAVLVNNWSGSTNGYTIDFGASTATIFDNVPPSIQSVNTPIACGANTITFQFSEAILCNTLTTGDLVLNGPGGPYTITNVTGAICAAGGTQEDEYTITVTPPITTAGNYSLDLVGGSGFVEDLCGNTAAAGSLPFVVANTIGYNLVWTDETCISSDDGTMTITGNGGTGPYTYDLQGPTPGNNTTGVFSGLIDGNYTVTVTDNASGCSTQFTHTIAQGALPCCAADAGTTNQSITGNALNNYILCDGDELVINSNGDFVDATGGTSPGIQYAIYTCPPDPTISDPNLDPCFSGFFATSTSPNMTTLNGGGSAGGYLAALAGAGVVATNNTLWFAPVTVIETNPVITTDPNCVDVGPAVEVTYLEPITWTGTEDCATSSWNVTVNGGYPELFGGNFTVSNPQPAGVIAAPLTIPHGGTVNLTNLPYNQTFSFDVTDANGCTQTITVGPYTCCPADAGTATANQFGNGTTPYILCDQDTIVIVGDGNHVDAPGVGPGITFGIYTCPPTPGIDPATDPCYTGFVTGSIGFMTDINQGGSAGGLLGAILGIGQTVNNNTLYFAPFTLNDSTNLLYDPTCFDVGAPIAVQYLEPIVWNATEDCNAGVWNIDMSGGHAEMFGTNFTVNNLQVTPANAGAALSTGTVANNGTVSVTGLTFGDTFTFDIIDANGCPMTVTGGPYTCCPADAGTSTGTLIGAGNTDFILCDGDAISIVSNGDFTNSPGVGPGLTYAIYTCPPTPGVDPALDPCYTGFVTGTIGSMLDVNIGGSGGGLLGAIIGAGLPVTNNTLYFSPLTMIDTTNLLYDPNCFDVGPPIAVQYLEPLVTNATPTDATCGAADGTITVTATGGEGTYTYEIIGVGQNGTGVFNNLLASTYDAVVIDGNGCSDTIPVTIQNLGAPTIASTTFTDPLCFISCDGTITVNVTPGSGTPPYTYDVGPGTGQAGNVFTNLCAGNYVVTVTDDNGCVATANVTLTDPPVVTVNTTQVDLACFGDNSGEIDIVAGGGDGNYEYSITGGAPFTPQSNWTGLAAGTYDVVVQDGNACQATTQVILTEPTELTFAFSAFDATCNGICDGYAIVIPAGGTVVGSYNFAWSNGIAGPTSAQATNLCDGNYSLTVTDDNGCSVDTNFVIGAPAAVTIDNIVITDESCAGACDGTITITAPLAVEFSIDNGTTFVPGNVFNNLCAGNYDIIVRNANQCAEDSVVTINSPSPITLTVSNDTTVCIGGTATLIATPAGGTPPYTYTWDNGLPDQDTHQVNPVALTTYCVTVTDANGCTSTQECINVDLLPALSVVTSNDTTICPGETVTVSAQGAGGDGNFTYDWNNGQGAGPTLTVTPSVTTVYVVTVSDGCTTPVAIDSVTVTVSPNPQPTFSAVPSNGCAPLTVLFTNTSDPATIGGDCLWMIDGAPASTDCDSFSHTFDIAGDYDISLQFTSPAGCFGDTTIADFVNVYGNPIADFSFGPQPTNFLNPEIVFNNASQGATNYYWEFGSGGMLGSSVDENPTFTFPDSTQGFYEACLWAYSPEGCVDSTCQVVEIDGQFVLYVPNAFTPDGDGLNETFYPRGSGFDNEVYTLLIFDRWGELVFESYNVDNHWDGTIKGTGVMGMTDVYVWKLVVRDDWTGEQKDYVGHVTLLR